MNQNCKTLENTVLVSLPGDRVPTEEEVFELASRLRTVFPVADDDFEQLIRSLHARLTITMEMGTVLIEQDHVPWLMARKPAIDPFYWNRYSMLLKKLSWPPQVVSTLDRITDEILDQIGNPELGNTWKRRGLVVGDVQSGKTATYTALCSKAADAGYKIIILLTGTLENLRRQTQERLDEGFVGRDSSTLLQQKSTGYSRKVGVGLIDSSRSAGVFTSRQRDFNREIVNALGFTLNAFTEPVLVVIKKNKRILENLRNWLRSYNADSSGRIDSTLLLIDDEADNASINTRSQDNDPTAINEGIRSILRLFTRTSYVGFTATPFANIFVDPDTEDEMLGHDLFPRDFIYCLEAPSNYTGPSAVFAEDSRLNMLRPIGDAGGSFPPRHRSSLIVEDLPESLREAIRTFIISTTIRDLRGEESGHRSMLVNVSQFTLVQDQVAGLIDLELRNIQQDIRNYSQLPPSEALKIESISELRRTWEREYQGAGFGWPSVQKGLLDGTLPIVVKAVNQRTGAASLDYKAYSQTGLRVIAVGGNSLSRGLTLEGLCVSYFYRNSQMYDTLLQMGRWFGYRDGYEDLVRLWITDDAAQWYSHISLASEELRDECKKMRVLARTPRDFGLKVRLSPDSLIVTARNKMRLSYTIERLVSVSERLIETPRIRSSRDSIRANVLAIKDFLDDLSANSIARDSSLGHSLWRKVPKALIAKLISSYNSHPSNMRFQGADLADFLDRTPAPGLADWDVAIPNGEEEVIDFFGVRLQPQKRTVEINTQTRAILVSGAKARVGSRGIEKLGIAPEKVKEIEEEYKASNPGKSIPDSKYREIRQRPLLLIHLVNAYLDKENPYDSGGDPLIALGLSFPKFDDSGFAGRVKYRVNLVEWRSMFESEADDEEDIEENGLATSSAVARTRDRF